jgi:hypothetical protein
MSLNLIHEVEKLEKMKEVFIKKYNEVSKELYFKFINDVPDNSSEIDYDAYIKEYNTLELSKSIEEMDFPRCESEDTIMYICPDMEGEFPFIFELNRKTKDEAMEIISDTILDYYKNSTYYDSCTNLCVEELLKIYLTINHIKIVNYIPVENVEALNPNWLRSNT